MGVSVDIELVYKVGEFIVLGSGVAVAMVRSGRLIERFEQATSRQAEEIHELKANVENLSSLIIKTTEMTGRMNVTDERMMAQGRRFDELSNRVNRWLDREEGNK